MRVLCVGDSMTIGVAGDHTWRYRMWQHLGRTLPPGAAHLVGPRSALHEGSQAYADPAFPPEARAHLAGWGEGWLHMAPAVGEAVAGCGADTLLVSLGLIDLGFYTDAAQTVRNVERFWRAARAANPRVRGVLLPVVPNVRAAHDAEFAAECARFNVLLGKTVAELSQPRSPLLLASAPQDWSVARDTYDGTHPSVRGEHRIAAAFAGALHQAWSVGGPYEAHGAYGAPGAYEAHSTDETYGTYGDYGARHGGPRATERAGAPVSASAPASAPAPAPAPA